MRRFRCSVSDDDVELDESYSEIPMPTAMPALAETLQKITVCVLGAPQVGKSSIIRQFVDYKPAIKAADGVLGHQCYYTTIVINGELYELKIIECPAVHLNGTPKHNNDSCMNIHKADAYLLVFDVTNKESLEYITELSLQLKIFQDCRSQFEYNDLDQMSTSNAHTKFPYEVPSYCDETSTSSSTSKMTSTLNNPVSPMCSTTTSPTSYPASPISGTSTPSATTSPTSVFQQTPIVIVGNKYDMPQKIHISKQQRAAYFSNMPERCPYVESSAKCNWHIMEIFKELIKSVNYSDNILQESKGNRNGHMRRKQRVNQCVIL